MGIPKVCLAFVLLVIMRIEGSQEPVCNVNDLTALKALSQCLEADIGWWNSNSSNCCSWTGITCDNSSVLNINYDRVVGLELGNKRLSGTLCEDLVGLEQLRILNLSHNYLHGNIPDYLFRFRNLEILDLSGNAFVGWLPTGIHLPSLKYLDLSKNSFTHLLSSELCTTSSHIQYLNLANNLFRKPAAMNLENCSSLQCVYLSGNGLSGTFPESLIGLQHLRVVHLEENRFSGPLHDGLGNLSSLVELDISSNNFSGSLPDVFGRLTKLESFSAGSNGFSGLLPISLANSPSLLTLDLHNNSLDGPININCSANAMTRVTSLHLGSNKFLGPIPDSLSSCQSLGTLSLARNKLGGEVPTNFKNLHSLEFLYLGNNSLENISAALEILQHCKNLTTLVLSRNFYQEEMPDDVNLHFRNLKALIIPNCRLRGSFPVWLSGCKMLQLLDLSWNSLAGSIPYWLGNSTFLFYLDLSNNSFTGEIPESLTRLQNLVHPTVLLKERFAVAFPLQLKRKDQGASLQYNNICRFPPTVDLSFNMLSGPIWPSFGNLKSLHFLRLNMNNLSGTIPETLSGMESLEGLDLSHNKLSGEIPNSLVHLSFLSKFDVSYNELHGNIPTGGQFTTFPNSSFEGNEALCGKLFGAAACEEEHTSPLPSLGEETMKMEIVGWQFGIGAAMGFVLTVSFCYKSGWVLPKMLRPMPQKT